MKTLLLTVGLTGMFFAVGVLFLKGGLPGQSADAETPPDSSAAGPAAADPVDALADELAVLQRRLAHAESQADSLRRVIDERDVAVSAEDAEATAAAAQVTTELATTLAKMDDDPLAAVVQRLDGRSFVRLYDAASARNRGRLLDALTPAQAAAFVRHRLPGAAPVHLASAADTTASR
ncbi:hypothetical protein [Rubrivirga sp. IMCC45206]|uniref:hypothetical protein n=1 Tax=Rubrivirga sp. IMCC45206 TaxID=3391614 RepID=UPI00399006D1